MTYRIVQVYGEEFEAELLALQRVCLPESDPLGADQWGAEHGDWWLVYDAVKAVVGFAALRESQGIPAAGYLSRAAVLPDHRGNGLQKRLIRVRERQARVNGWDWLVTDTYDNPASANSLISCGYKTFTPTEPWAFASSVYWRRRLTL